MTNYYDYVVGPKSAQYVHNMQKGIKTN